ncbi:hypothetical protein GQ457_16G019720 [Hibiscus cannabinus]
MTGRFNAPVGGKKPENGNKKLGNSGNFAGKKLVCTHCGFFGHTIDKCYRKHGFPPGYRNRNQSSRVNQVGSCDADCSSELINTGLQCSVEGSVPQPPVFTKEQYENLLSLLQERASSSVSQPVQSQINALSSNFNVSDDQKTGTVLNCSTLSVSWIIDSGATDHIVHSVSFFSNYSVVHDKFVKLPNNELVQVCHIGTVQINDFLVLHNVFHIPNFGFNLISVSQLVKENLYSLIFTSDACFIQEVSPWKMIGMARLTQGLYL